jgi:predicted nuclease with TOPRIM domain
MVSRKHADLHDGLGSLNVKLTELLAEKQLLEKLIAKQEEIERVTEDISKLREKLSEGERDG